MCDLGRDLSISSHCGGAARADGYVTKGPAPVTLTVSSWTGAYGGVNGGYAWSGNSATFSGEGGAGNNQFSHGLGPNGFTGGGQLGYNWQIAREWVAGLETDLQYSGADGNASTTGTAAGLSATANSQQDLKWFGTLRGRLGFLATDELLPDRTAGLAYGKTDATANLTTAVAATVTLAPFTLTCVGNTACIAGADSKTSVGWTAGLGFEWIVWHDVTLKGEYLHVDLGDPNVTLVAAPPSTGNGFANAHFDNSYEIVRAGLNIRLH